MNVNFNTKKALVMSTMNLTITTRTTTVRRMVISLPLHSHCQRARSFVNF